MQVAQNFRLVSQVLTVLFLVIAYISQYQTFPQEVLWSKHSKNLVLIEKKPMKSRYLHKVLNLPLITPSILRFNHVLVTVKVKNILN